MCPFLNYLLLISIAEKKCKDWCFGYFKDDLMQPCTHYKYHPDVPTTHPNMFKCLLFHVNITTSSSYKCNMIAGDVDVSDADREKCLEDVHPVPVISSAYEVLQFFFTFNHIDNSISFFLLKTIFYCRSLQSQSL